MAGLRRRDIDLPRREVMISQPLNEVNGKLLRARKPKGGRCRSIPIGPKLAKKLERWMRELPDDPGTPLLPAPRDWMDAAAGRQCQAAVLRDGGASLGEIAKALGYAHESSAFRALKAAARTKRSQRGPLIWNNCQRRHWQAAVDRAARRRAVLKYPLPRRQGR